MRKLIYISFFSLFLLSAFAQKKFQISGLVTEMDSLTPLPFTYVINTKSGNGCVTDFNGKFVLQAENSDTLLFSSLGYTKKQVLVALIKQVNDSTKASIIIAMKLSYHTLPSYTAQSFKIKPHEREYMSRIINKPKLTGADAFNSPLTFLYEMYSKKGREQQKLKAIFERIFMEEQVAQKLNPEILRKLTGDDTINFERFRKFCYSVSDEYIITHEGYELYEAVMKCYKRWLKEGQ